MKKIAVLVLLACGLAAAAPWKNEALRIRIDFPGKWKPVTAKMADQRLKTAKDSDDSTFYAELAKRARAGNFFLFEESPKSPVRADLQSAQLGKPLGRALTERDIRNLCPLWASKHDENDRPFGDCQPRKLGVAWTAQLFYPDDGPDGRTEYQIKYFRPDGTLILLTVTGDSKQAEALFKNTVFY